MKNVYIYRESADGFAGRNIMATVKAFDKRHRSSKYYVSRYVIKS